MPGEYLGDFPAAGQVIPYYFDTYDSNDPTASVTMTGLAVTGIEVYKGVSMTQRASDAGYALIDTDGIDVDSTTGFHGFSIDTSDNTDAGFYAAGNDYTVRVNGLTVDGGSVGFVAFRFSIDNRGLLRPTTAQRTLDVTATGEAGLDFNNVNLPDGAIPALGIIDSGTAQAATGTTLQLRSAAAFANDELIGATVVITGGSAGVGQARIITDYVNSTDTATVDTWTTTPTGTITYIVVGTPPNSASSPVPASLSGTQTFNMTGNITGNLSGSVGSVTSLDAAALQQIVDDLENGGRLDLLIDAIKAKTDSLTFTVANQVDANIQYINDAVVTGDGNGTPWDSGAA